MALRRARERRNLMMPGMGQMEVATRAGHGDEEVVEAHDGVDFVVDAADVGGDFGVEEGAGDDLERERHHGGSDVDGCAGLPCGRGGRRRW